MPNNADILLGREQGVAVITLNRPAQRNCLSRKGVLSEAWPLPNVPTIVLTQVHIDNSWTGATPEGVQIWRDLQTEYFKQSTNARHIVIDHVGHNIHEEDPDLVVETIRQLIAMVNH